MAKKNEPILNIQIDLKELSINSLLLLKKVVSNVNNTITTKLAVKFVNSDIIQTLIGDHKEELEKDVNEKNANTNGYDIVWPATGKELGIIAEVKSSIPIKNAGTAQASFGPKQIESIEYDLDALLSGKDKKKELFEKSHGKLEQDKYYKFLVLFDSPDVKAATKGLLKNYKDNKNVKLLEQVKELDKLDTKKVYIVFVK